MKNPMNKTILIATIALVSTLFGKPLFAQDKPANEKSPKEFQRQIYVPFESLDVLLQGNSNRVLLTREEYDALLKSAKTREIKRAPLDSAIVSAKYSGEVSDGVAIIKGELIVESLNEGLTQILLPFSGVAIRSAMVGDKPAKLWRTPKGQIALLTSEQSRQTCNDRDDCPDANVRSPAGDVRSTSGSQCDKFRINRPRKRRSQKRRTSRQTNL